MKSIDPPTPDSNLPIVRIASIALVVCLLLAIIVVVRSGKTPSPVAQTATFSASSPMTVTHSGRDPNFRTARPNSAGAPDRPAEEIVTEKMNQFARSRADIVAAMAREFNLTVPEEVSRFFAAAQAGNWPETTNLFASIQKLRMSGTYPPELAKLWPAIVETYGVAEHVHQWPAQQLLDYGNAVLDSLRPGMVYVGGNDAGRFIPTLLADTSGGEPHIVITQNGLADGSYLDYVRFLYGNKLNTLTADESQKSFQDYLVDAQKRLKHDQDFPNEPKQVRPGEDIQIKGNSVNVSGQIAVMSINELLLQTLLQKNPNVSFALEESFPLKSFYADANTLGPITELRTDATANPLTADRAAQSLDYWRSLTQTLLADTDPASAPREAYAKMIMGQANLFQDRKLTGEAEQAFQLANQLNPNNTATVFSYVNLLVQQNRYDEARRIAQTAASAAPDNQQFRDLITSLNRMK